MCGPVYRPPAGAATGAQYGLLGPHEQSHQRERLFCLSVSLYLGHAWQEQKSREGGDFFVEKILPPRHRAEVQRSKRDSAPRRWRFSERKNTPRLLLRRRKSHNVHEADGRKYIEMTTEPRPRGKHFTKDERAKIETLRKAGHTHQYIADFLGCCRSAVTKEIKKARLTTWMVQPGSRQKYTTLMLPRNTQTTRKQPTVKD